MMCWEGISHGMLGCILALCACIESVVDLYIISKTKLLILFCLYLSFVFVVKIVLGLCCCFKIDLAFALLCCSWLAFCILSWPLI